MKKLLSVVLSVMMLFTAVAALAETAAEETGLAIGEYTLYNCTGEAITELYLYEAGDEDKGENMAVDFEDGLVITVEGAADAVLVLEFVTESGYTGIFETLHIETTPISLLMVDTTSGATSISFFAPEGAETAETETAAQ